MYKIYAILLSVMLACIGCEWRMRYDLNQNETNTFIERYDKVESFFLQSGDFSALQQMQTRYPAETRRLIEDVLQLGKVDDVNIKSRFYIFFQDTTLQSLIAEVAKQYEDLTDLDEELAQAFSRLQEIVPQAKVPKVYTQISSLDQSIVVDSGQLAISLDKYLGADYPLYVKYGYTDQQRAMMERDYIIPDCLGFYLLSLYNKPDTMDRNIHMGRIQHVVNHVLNRRVFENDYVNQAETLTDSGRSFTELLENNF